MKLTKPYLAGLCASLVFATSTVFAASFQFDAKNNEPLYQTSLPKVVYEQSHSNALQDLTITNAAGEQVPYALMSYAALYPQTSNKLESKPLLVFPIEEANLSHPDALRIQLETTMAKTTLHVTTGASIVPDRQTNAIYLVDAGEKHPALQTLSVDWQGAEGQFVTLEILASDDLKNWSHAGSGVLLKTTQAGNSILNNSITFDSHTDARYLQLRLAEPGKSPDFNLTQVTAEYRSQHAIALPLLWQDLSFLSRTQDNKTGQVNLEFEAPGRYPATHLQVKLPQTNTITNVTIFVRNKTNEPWTYLTNASLYRMTQQGKTLTNPEIRLNPTVARYWQLQFNQASGGIGAENPTIAVGWLAETVVWNARGAAPFTLHVGENPDLVNTVSIAGLIPGYEIEKVKKLPVAKLIASSSENTNTALAKTDTQNTWTSAPDYKSWLLWGGLFLGVLLLAGMAYSLLKNDNKQ